MSDSNFIIPILKSVKQSGKNTGFTNIIITRPYSSLETEILKVFKGQTDVVVKIDERNGERRTGTMPVSTDNRKLSRRISKDVIMEVVLVS
jgi:hypothetical protein